MTDKKQARLKDASTAPVSAIPRVVCFRELDSGITHAVNLDYVHRTVYIPSAAGDASSGTKASPAVLKIYTAGKNAATDAIYAQGAEAVEAWKQVCVAWGLEG